MEGIQESDWPAIEAPADVPRVEGEAPATAVAATAPTPPAGTPPIAAAPQTPPAAPVPSPEPPVTAQPNLSDEVRAQLTEITSFNRALLQQNTVLTQQIAEMRARQDAPPPAPPVVPEVVDEQTQAIRDRMYQVMPWLKDLEELSKQKARLLGAADAVPQFQQDRDAAVQAENRFWDEHRDRTLGSIHGAVAVELLGAGKTAADLNAIVKAGLDESFRGWVRAEPARAARYERQDGNLVGEFVAEYKAHAIAPLRRTEQVAALEAAATTPAVPRGGPSVPPGPAAPTTPTTEDEVYAASWDQFRQRQQVAS